MILYSTPTLQDVPKKVTNTSLKSGVLRDQVFGQNCLKPLKSIVHSTILEMIKQPNDLMCTMNIWGCFPESSKGRSC